MLHRLAVERDNGFERFFAHLFEHDLIVLRRFLGAIDLVDFHDLFDFGVRKFCRNGLGAGSREVLGGDFFFDLDDRAVLFNIRLVFAALLGKLDVEHDRAVLGLLFDALEFWIGESGIDRGHDFRGYLIEWDIVRPCVRCQSHQAAHRDRRRQDMCAHKKDLQFLKWKS